MWSKGREAGMDVWWWLLIGLIAWFAVSVAVGLWLGPVLRHCSQAREALDAHVGEIPAGPHAPPLYWQQAS